MEGAFYFRGAHCKVTATVVAHRRRVNHRWFLHKRMEDGGGLAFSLWQGATRKKSQLSAVNVAGLYGTWARLHLVLNGEGWQFEHRASTWKTRAFHFANLDIGSRLRKFQQACTELLGELPKVVAVAGVGVVLKHLNDLCKEGHRKGYWDIEVAAVGPTGKYQNIESKLSSQEMTGQSENVLVIALNSDLGASTGCELNNPLINGPI